MPVPDITPQAATPAPSLYETDFYAWSQEQAALLRVLTPSRPILQNSPSHLINLSVFP